MWVKIGEVKKTVFVKWYIAVNVNKVAIKSLQGSRVTETVLDGQPMSSCCKFTV